MTDLQSLCGLPVMGNGLDVLWFSASVTKHPQRAKPASELY
jgi:hypothetical protein